MLSMYGTPLRKMTYIPASPGAEFLVQFGQLERAEALVEADVTFIEELMANLTIPSVTWFVSSHGALDSLIARAFWISPLVRERASSQLAKLLLKEQTVLFQQQYQRVWWNDFLPRLRSSEL